MRVLIGMPDKTSLGGPIYCEPPFVEGLRRAGVEVDEEVYVFGDGPPTPVWKRVLRVIKSARRLRRRTLAYRYDVVHLNTSIDKKCVMRDLVTMRFLRSSGLPVHLKMHGSSASFLRTKSLFWRFVQKRVFGQAANIGVLSSEERENFLHAGCPSEKLSNAKYIVDANDFRHDPDFRARHGIGPNTPMLLFSARFIPAKGLLDVIEACSHLRNAGKDFVLFCLGDGPVRTDAEKLTDELNLNENVRFFGYIPEAETAAFHANSTIFVLPTYHDEGFPLVILKSLAAGLPIITTRIRGAADQLTDPENCLWVEPRDPADLAMKLARLLDDSDLRDAMTKNNRLLAEEFTAQNVSKDYMRMYADLINALK